MSRKRIKSNQITFTCKGSLFVCKRTKESVEAEMKLEEYHERYGNLMLRYFLGMLEPESARYQEALEISWSIDELRVIAHAPRLIVKL